MLCLCWIAPAAAAGAARAADDAPLPTVLRPSARAGAVSGDDAAPHRVGGLAGPAALLVAQAQPYPPFGPGFYPGGAVGLGEGPQYPADAPYPPARFQGGVPPFPPPIQALAPPRPPRCPLIIRVGRGLSAPVRSRVVTGRPNCV